MKSIPAILTTAIVVAFSSAASGQVTVANTFNSGALTTLGATQFAFTYEPVSPGNTIVFGTYIDNGVTGTAVTFNGSPAEALLHSGRTTLSYLRNAPASVDIVVSLSGNGNTNSGYIIYELSGVTAGDVVLSAGDSITTPAEAAFVVSFAGGNNAPIAVESTAPAVGSIITTFDIADYNSGIGGGGIAHGYGLAGQAGPQTLGWTVPGATGNANVAFPTGLVADSDGDGLFDVWEITHFGDLTTARGTEAQDPSMGGQWDNDNDGFDNLAEYEGNSDPTERTSVPGDVDGDGLTDTWEITHFGSLIQGPRDDFDGDYNTNLEELTADTLPADAASWPDVDEDLMNDAWELENDLSITSDDSGLDADTDGSTNLEEHDAGTDPQDSTWWPGNSTLRNRWSFNGDLEDPVGGYEAEIIDPDGDEAIGGGSTLEGGSLTLDGGGRAESEYVVLGYQLLSELQADGPIPVTIELWATPRSLMTWSRIFDFGTENGSPITDETLTMSWSNGTEQGQDQVLWNGRGTINNSNAPYLLDVPYHIVMTIVPAVHTGGAIATGAQVTWYTSPATEGHPLLEAKGSFNTTGAADLRHLLDDVFVLGRSMYATDQTANASYDEVRIWAGALGETERELFHLLGPDNIDRSDTDTDGFPDAWETASFGNLTTATAGMDKDLDSYFDEEELADESDPDNENSIPFDRDGDGLDDELFEIFYFNNLLQDGEGDPDNDLYTNEQERVAGSDPSDAASTPDSDDDGLEDGWEIANFGGTAAFDGDDNPDGDFDDNLTEFTNGWDPNDKYSGSDSDADGLPDYWEFDFFGSFATYIGSDDPDNDGSTNAEELAARTNPDDDGEFPDLNGDGLPDGRRLVATDGFAATSFNTGLNWDNGLAPVAGLNYMVNGTTLRSPDLDAADTVFAGDVLAIVNGSLWMKGIGSTASANYSLSSAIIRNAVSGFGPVTLGGTIDVRGPSEMFADNGAIILTAPVSGSGGLLLNGNATAIREVQFDNPANTYSGVVTMNPTASLVVNGTLNPGAGSTYNFAPGASGASNVIGGTGEITLGGTFNINLANAVLAEGSNWPLVINTAAIYDPALTITGFTADDGDPGFRLWTNGDFEFDETTGVLSYTGTGPAGYGAWALAKGLTAGLNDLAEDNPDGDPLANVLEYQLNGDPLAAESGLVTAVGTETHLTLTFERYDLSEADANLNFRWGTDLVNWNNVPVGATSFGPDSNGVVITVTEDGGESADYDLIEIQLPRSNAVGGKLFWQLEGTRP